MNNRYRSNYFGGALGKILEGALLFDRFLQCWVDNSAIDRMPPVIFGRYVQ